MDLPKLLIVLRTADKMLKYAIIFFDCFTLEVDIFQNN